MRPYGCGGSNLSTVLVLWGIYIKKRISLVRVWLQPRKGAQSAEMHLQNFEKLYNKNAFRLGEKLPYFFTIHYYLLPCQIPELVKSEE